MTMRTVLLFPPMADPCQPYLSLPALTAFLRQAGYPVIQRDLNIEALDAFLSPERLQRSYATITDRLLPLEAKPKLSDSELPHYEALVSARLTAPYVISHVDQAKQVLRSADTFYDFERYRWSIHTLSRGMALISAEHYPTIWGLRHFYTRHTRDKAWSVPKLLETIENERENPFVAFFRERVIPWLQREAPDLVGISITYLGQIVPGFTLSHQIKQALPETHVCLGGAALTELAERLICSPELLRIADSVITHEGEHALLALVQGLEKGETLKNVPNLLYLTPSGEVVRNPLGPPEDVNALPTPDYRGLPLSLYFAPEPCLLLATSRGCYWHRCAFCTVSTAVQSACYRPRAKELVKQDIQTLILRHNVRHLFLSEDSVAPKRLRMMADISQELREELNWVCETRLEGLTQELCHQLAATGCRLLIFGLESATQRVLDLMDKGTRIEKVKKVLDHCEAAEIAVSLQTFIGFPGESESEARKTLQFLLENSHRVHAVAFGQFALQHGSRVQRDPQRYGVTFIDYPPDNVLATCYDYQVSAGMTPAEIKRLHAEGLKKIQKAYHYKDSFYGHAEGTHVLLYLTRYGTQGIRCLPQPEPALVPGKLSDLVPVVSTDIVHHLIRRGDNGNLALLIFHGGSGRLVRTGAEAERLLQQCDGQASIGQIAAHFANQSANGAAYIEAYYQALSLAKSFIQIGILEIER